ncbi:UNVERIFIED_CONTAM: Retrovirus-related Pol polyprotein from transposon RE1 [Sesamum angustifolium]|uniref:Retrovirus-related Pol polyprotein from transposon RE1 n=1 Tax=Sesamum angustifolium TaxID=2727405 RepID=A0AAW2J4K8_9LAMI
MHSKKNETWELVDLPKGKRPIGCKWIFRVKLKPTGEVDKYKARLVAKGYNLVAGLNYVESFSPIAKCVTVRLLLEVATVRWWTIHQLDINNAFLHGFLEEDIYMHVPEGYVAPLGKQSSHDHCLFTKAQGADFLALLVYVDDVLLCGSSSFLIDGVKNYLDAMFTIKDLGYSNYFLGLEIARAPTSTTVTQIKYVFDLSQFVQSLCKHHMEAALHLVRYLKGCPTRDLFFLSSNDLHLLAYCDVDWATCVDSRHSLTGYCIFLGLALVSWKT